MRILKYKKIVMVCLSLFFVISSNPLVYAIDKSAEINETVVSTLDEINNAILNATPDDIITVADNTHIVGVINIDGKSITLQGGIGSSVQGIWMRNHSKVTLQNLSVDAKQLGVNTYVRNNPGPAIIVDSSKLYLKGGMVIENALSTLGISDLVGGGVAAINHSYISIEDNVIIQNNVSHSYKASICGGGGGIGIVDSELLMSGGTITNNSVGNFRRGLSGGGILIIGETSKATINSALIEKNTTTNGGGGIAIESGELVLDNTTISNNNVIKTSGGTIYGGGGGLNIGQDLNAPPPVVTINEGTMISNNSAINYGGGITIITGNLFLNGGTIHNNLVNEIDSYGFTGGGIEIIHIKEAATPNVYLKGNFMCENNKIDNLTSNIFLGTYGFKEGEEELPVIQLVDKFDGKIGVINESLVRGNGSRDVIVYGGYDPQGEMAQNLMGENALVYSDDENYFTRYENDGSNHKIVLGQYEVKIDARGGVFETAEELVKYMNLDQSINKPSDPVLADHIFLGWATSPHSHDYYDFNSIVNEDFTLYAIWKPEVYTIDFDSNGGMGSMNTLYQNGKEGVTLIENTFIKEHYIFAGWNTKADGTGTVISDKTPHLFGTEDVILYAQWNIEKFKIDFHTGGGSEIESINVDYDNLVIEPTAPTREGYVFEGWYKDSTFSSTWNFTIDKVTEAATLYAKWIANTYSIAYDANTGTGTMAEQIFETGSTITLNVNTYVKLGFNFIGWNTKADGTGTTYQNKQELQDMLPEDVILYAQWKVQGPNVFVEIPKALKLVDGEDGFASCQEEVKIVKVADDEQWYTDDDILVRTLPTFELKNSSLTDSYNVSVYRSDNTQYLDEHENLMVLNAKATDKLSDTFTIKTRINHLKDRGIYSGIMQFVIEFQTSN